MLKFHVLPSKLLTELEIGGSALSLAGYVCVCLCVGVVGVCRWWCVCVHDGDGVCIGGGGVCVYVDGGACVNGGLGGVSDVSCTEETMAERTAPRRLGTIFGLATLGSFRNPGDKGKVFQV